MAILRPDDDKDLQAAVEQACAEERALEVVGAGTKRALGRPVVGDDRLDLSGLAEIIYYEPAELVLTARPGARLAEVETLLEGAGQALAFEAAGLQRASRRRACRHPRRGDCGEPLRAAAHQGGGGA